MTGPRPRWSAPMTDWDALGLPCPSRANYGYKVDAGLSRTPFACALPEQGLARTSRRQTFSLNWRLDAEQLARAEAYLLAYGYDGDGIDLELLTGAGLEIVRVRLAADLEISALDRSVFQLTAKLETLVSVAAVPPITCPGCVPVDPYQHHFMATSPYPFLISDAMQSGARLVSGHLSPYRQDAYQSRHDFTSGTILQTRQFVPLTAPPDAVTSEHRFTYGEIAATKTLVNVSQAPDAVTSAHVFTAGEIVIVGVATTVLPETITATAWITGGTLE